MHFSADRTRHLLQWSGLKTQDKVSFWKKNLLRLLKHVYFFCLKWKTCKGRTRWKATVEIRTNFNHVKMFIAGLNSEGLYRVSGFSDLIEDVKMAFDRGTVFPACWNLVLMYKIHPVFLQSLCLTLHCTSGLKESDGCAGRRGDSPSEKHISFTLAFIAKISFSPSISICAPVTMCVGRTKLCELLP